MQLNKQIIIILILASLLFSAIGAAFYFYNKNRSAQKSKNELVTIFIAKEDIKKNTLINSSHLAKTKVAKQYLLNKPLLKKEIIGKYTNERIYKNEVFLKQKLSTKMQQSKAKVLDFDFSSYNMKFSMFNNPNYSLHQGDKINIISVYPKEGTQNKKGKYTDFDVQYIANNIKILGFMRDGFTESETITKQKVKKVVKKKLIEEILDVKSDEIVLDIQPRVLISLIKDYNKGNQLWMIKTKDSVVIDPMDMMSSAQKELLEKERIAFAKQKDELDAKLKAAKDAAKAKSLKEKEKKIKKVVKPKIYKFKWYEPKNNVVQKSAVIDYTNDEKDESSKTKSVNIVINAKKICRSIKDKLIIGNVDRFYIRDEGSTKSQKKAILERNTIIPYLEKMNYWYKTCDGQYISKNVVREIPYSYAVKRAGKR